MGQSGRRCFKSEINDSKEIAFESFQQIFNPNVPLKKQPFVTVQSIATLDLVGDFSPKGRVAEGNDKIVR
ncbi:MAG: hypothetical protein LBB88_10445 [Planctomycetaceae bacterium]|nr:hypothetical protein [Planctomycetaceae bacterium]